MRYKAIIAYDGSEFNGFQRQDHGRTVQGELERTLARLNSGTQVNIHGAGRTDARVHALGQVIHFDLPQERDEEKLRFALDTQTPEDIAVNSVEQVSDDFHSRYNPHEKTYEFHVDYGLARSPFKRHYASYFPYPINIELVEAALKLLEGTHDFTGFCAAGSSVENKVRTIYEASVVDNTVEKELVFTFRGNGFLYKMIRIMVGTLLKIGNERMEVSNIKRVIESKNRDLAGPTAHPEGLFLKEVKYLS